MSTLDEDRISRDTQPLKWAREKLVELDAGVRANIRKAYEPEFLEAAALLFDLEPVEFRGLVDKLKNRGSRPADFERKAKDRLRELKEAEKIRKAQAAATGGSARGPKQESQATALVTLAKSKCDLFHHGDDCYASVENDGHIETHSLKGRTFRRWLSREYMVAHGTAPNGEALGAAINTLAGFAQFDGAEWPTHVRVADHNGKVYIDLCDARWRIIEVSDHDWRLIESRDAPVRFRRAHGMQALPEPERGGSIEDLYRFLNLASDDDRRLVVGCLHAAFRGHGPYALLGLNGEQGAAKTTNARVLRECIDPNLSALRSPPKEPRDLAIAARNGWFVAFDNLSRISEWLSDALCRLSTGGGFSTRTLFSDEDETIFESQRPTIITGIGEVVTESDLLDRAVLITAPSISEEDRKTEANFWREFYEARPKILGALLDGVSTALRNISTITMERKPRMADFALWCEAAASAFGWEPGEFLQAYQENRAAAGNLALQTVLAESIQRMVLPWQGTATELLKHLETQFDILDDSGNVLRSRPRPKDWPASAHGLSVSMRKIAPNLRQVGISVAFERSGKDRTRRMVLSRLNGAAPEDKGKPPSAPPARPPEGISPKTIELFPTDGGRSGRTPSNGAEPASAVVEPKTQGNPPVFPSGRTEDAADAGFPSLSEGGGTEKNLEYSNGAAQPPRKFCEQCGGFNCRYDEAGGILACFNCDPPGPTAHAKARPTTKPKSEDDPDGDVRF